MFPTEPIYLIVIAAGGSGKASPLPNCCAGGMSASQEFYIFLTLFLQRREKSHVRSEVPVVVLNGPVVKPGDLGARLHL